ncbi:hypothetical protein NKG05_20270 [Oerskovia sp. M15]
MSELGSEVRTVTEDELSRALLMITERAKLVVEPAGLPASRRCSPTRAGWRGRSWPSCRAGTSTPRAAARAAARARGGRTVHADAGPPRRPPGALAQMLDVVAGVGAASCTSTTTAPTCTSRSAKHGYGCRSRPRARSTARRSSRSCGRGYRVLAG